MKSGRLQTLREAVINDSMTFTIYFICSFTCFFAMAVTGSLPCVSGGTMAHIDNSTSYLLGHTHAQ